MRARGEKKIKIPNVPSLCVGGARVQFERNQEEELEAIQLTFKGIGKEEGDGEKLFGRYEELYTDLKARAYRVAAYLSNRILAQTGYDLLYPYRVCLATPDSVTGETLQEKKEIEKGVRQVSSLQISLSAYGSFDPTTYEKDFSYQEVYAAIAEAHRLDKPFAQFEQLYKVIEYFFAVQGAGRVNIKALHEHLVKNDCPGITLQLCEKVRQTRHRIIHPKHDDGHLSPQDLSALQLVEELLPELETIVDFLRWCPPRKGNRL
jgi:mannose-6-phosphate isomerase-like protein (cupin superfamily)